MMTPTFAFNHNCTYDNPTEREDTTPLGKISFYVLFAMFLCFTCVAMYSTKKVLLQKTIDDEAHQDYMKMFYYSADATLIRK